jgi:hypothetical protein
MDKLIACNRSTQTNKKNLYLMGEKGLFSASLQDA